MKPGGGNICGLTKFAGLSPGTGAFWIDPQSCLMLKVLLSVVVMIFFEELPSRDALPHEVEAIILGTRGLSFRTCTSSACSGLSTDENNFDICETPPDEAGITQVSVITAEKAAIPELSSMLNAKITPAVFFILNLFGDF